MFSFFLFYLFDENCFLTAFVYNIYMDITRFIKFSPYFFFLSSRSNSMVLLCLLLCFVLYLLQCSFYFPFRMCVKLNVFPMYLCYSFVFLRVYERVLQSNDSWFFNGICVLHVHAYILLEHNFDVFLFRLFLNDIYRHLIDRVHIAQYIRSFLLFKL